MKKIVILSLVFVFALLACDKVKNAYTPVTYTGGLDPTLYPGDINNYVPPAFSPYTNTQRNVLIEDFTGHQCTYCPNAANVAHGLETSNLGRVFVSTIHTGPNGMSGFQATSAPTYVYDFTNAVGFQIGTFFGNLPGNNFSSNPCGNVSRVAGTAASISTAESEWTNKTNALIAANDLKVNIQCELNYFPSTKGAFIHIEVDQLQTIANELRLVVAFYEDSIIKPQTTFGVGTVYDYVHRDVLIAHVNGEMNGEKIDDSSLNAGGKNYFEMSYKIPDQIAADNSHFLIYVFDKVTLEIYQVIKKEIL
jgi:hypothetical protein